MRQLQSTQLWPDLSLAIVEQTLVFTEDSNMQKGVLGIAKLQKSQYTFQNFVAYATDNDESFLVYGTSASSIK